METRSPRGLIAGLLILSLCIMSGCGPKAVGRSVLGTKMTDREVKASIDGGGFITGGDGIATVTTSAGKFVVEKDRVLLNGKELATFPEDSKLIELDLTAGKLTIRVDGAETLSKQIAE